MTYNTRFKTRHLPPALQELVDTSLNGELEQRFEFAWGRFGFNN